MSAGKTATPPPPRQRENLSASDSTFGTIMTRLADDVADMHDPLSPFDLARDELSQARESGHDVASQERALAGLDPADAEAHEALYLELLDAPRAPGWSYDEPAGLEAILASLPDDPPDGRLGTATLEDKVLGGWLGRIAGCNLGKPVEAGDHWTTAHLREYLRARRRLAAAGLLPGTRPDAGRLRAARELAADDPWPRRRLRARRRHRLRDPGPAPARAARRALTPGHVAHGLAHLPPVSPGLHGGAGASTATCSQGIAPVERRRSRNPYREWIGALIRGDAFGWTHPGRPRAAILLAYQDASLSHVANGIYGELWAAAIVACRVHREHAREAFDALAALTSRRDRGWSRRSATCCDHRDAVARPGSKP